MFQETPCFPIAFYFLSTAENIKIESKVLIIVLLIYYIYRCIIFGLLVPSESKSTIPVVFIVTSFNLANGYIQLAGLIYYDHPETTITSFRF